MSDITNSTNLTGHVTADQIDALRVEAGAAGDDRQIAVCLVAQGISPSEWAEDHDRDPLPRIEMTVEDARAECAKVIALTLAFGEA